MKRKATGEAAVVGELPKDQVREETEESGPVMGSSAELRPLKRTRSSTATTSGGEGVDPAQSLPAELVWMIMHQMSVDDLCRAQLVCHEWYDVINPSPQEDESGSGGRRSGLLWRQVYFKTWPLPVLSSLSTDSSSSHQQDQATRESSQDWRRIAIERATLEHQKTFIQREVAKKLIEGLRIQADLLDEGKSVPYNSGHGRRDDEDDGEEEEEEQEEEEEEEEEKEREEGGDRYKQQTIITYKDRFRGAKKSGLITPGLDLHSLALLGKTVYREIRNQLYKEQLMSNTIRFLRGGLNDVHTRYSVKVNYDEQLKNAIAVFTALQPNILYRRVNIKIKRIDYISQGNYTVEVIIYSIATGLPVYIYFKQYWCGDMSSKAPDETFYWGDKPYTELSKEEHKVECGRNQKAIHPHQSDIKDVSPLQALLLGEEKKELVTNGQMKNFLDAVLNTGDTFIMSLDY